MDNSFSGIIKSVCSSSPVYRELKEAHDKVNPTAKKVGIDNEELYDLLIAIKAST